MKNILISKKVSIPFEFMLSVLLSSIMFLFVLGIVLGISELMYFLNEKLLFSKSVIEKWLILKEYIMYLDMIVVGLYLTIEFIVWIKELFLFAKEELFNGEDHNEK